MTASGDNTLTVHNLLVGEVWICSGQSNVECQLDRALASGENVAYSGPVLDAARFDGTRAVLTFTHAGRGLVAKDGLLRGFAIAGHDKKFVPADAAISGGTVVVSSRTVPAPDVNLFR